MGNAYWWKGLFLLIILIALCISALFTIIPRISFDKAHRPTKKSVNIDAAAKKPVAAEKTLQEVVIPYLENAGVTTEDLYMNNYGQFIVCVPREEFKDWLEKNRNAEIKSLTPLNAAGGQTEKLIVIYSMGK